MSDFMDRIDALIQGEVACLCQTPEGELLPTAPSPVALLSGSFNPLHDGHLGLVALAEKKLCGTTGYELSVTNVDKLGLTRDQIIERLTQFREHRPVWVTRAPTFVEKAELFPGTAFVLGVDTAVRLISPQYYQGDTQLRDRALARLRDLGAKLLVAGRLGEDGRFYAAERVPIAETFLDLFMFVNEEEFRIDLSSTELRGGS